MFFDTSKKTTNRKNNNYTYDYFGLIFQLLQIRLVSQNKWP